MHRLKTGLLAAAGSAGLVALSASPAFATITTPSVAAGQSYTVPVDNQGNPLPFTVTVNGFVPLQPVYAEICDGVPSSTTGYLTTSHCDNGTATTAVEADSTGTVTFTMGTPNETQPIRGESPSNLFNCLAPQDATNVQSNGSATPVSPAVYPPAGDTGPNGDNNYNPTPKPAKASVPSWTNCQLRIASSTAANTLDQQYLTLALQNTPGPQTPESPLTIALPAAAAVLLGGGALFVTRRRRRSAGVAA